MEKRTGTQVGCPEEAMYQNNFLTFSQPGDIADSMPNSLSHRSDYVNACLYMWCQKGAFETCNVTNPGFASTAEF